MRVPNLRDWRAFFQPFAILVCGMIIGAAVFMVIYQHNFNEILLMNDSLRHETKELRDKVEDLQKYQDRNTLIKSIVIDIEDSAADPTALDDVVRNKIIEQVKEQLNVFKGKPISLIADTNVAQMSRLLFGQRRLSDIQDKDYVVEIKALVVIYGELKVRIAVTEWKAPAS